MRQAQKTSPGPEVSGIDLDEPVGGFQTLARGAQLMLWSFRAIAFGHADCPALQRTLQVALGSAAEEAFSALFVAVRMLGWCARRKLGLHAPGCDNVSPDERWLLTVFVAAQQGLADGDERDVRHRLDGLVDSQLVDSLLITLQSAASLLEVNGYSLSPRQDAWTAPRSRRLH